MKSILKSVKFKKYRLIIGSIFLTVFGFLSIFLPIYFCTNLYEKLNSQTVINNDPYELLSASEPVVSSSSGLEWWQILAIVLSIVVAVIIFLVLFLVVKLLEKKYDDVDNDDETTFFTTDGTPPSTK